MVCNTNFVSRNERLEEELFGTGNAGPSGINFDRSCFLHAITMTHC